MNYKMFAKFLIYSAIPLSLSNFAYAGHTVMSTSDSAPLYPTSGSNKNTEVVIKNTSTVTLTTTDTNGGNLWVTYTPSSGVSQTSDTGGGQPSETAKFSFDSTTVGNVNTIKISVQHADSSNSGTNCSSGSTSTFTICIPKITAARPPGDTTINTFEKSAFNDIVTISGCDDFSQIEWVQMLTDNENYTDYSGTAHNVYNYGSGTIDWPTSHSGWASPGGTSGWTFTITGNTATLSPPDNHPDTSAVSATGTFQIGGTGQTYYYTELSSIALTFQDKIRRTGDTSGNLLGEYDWSVSWDNNNITWPVSPNAPTMAQYTAATGHTSGVYGGTVRSGSGANAGEWTNVQNMTIP